jgi:acetyltransferase-like isoleucine patch superfamily enzyme
MIDPTALLHDFARVVGDRSRFFLGAYSRIDDFAFVNIGARCEIGRHVHVAGFCSVIGGGELVMEDFSGLSAGCRLITGSDDFQGPWLTNPTVPAAYTNVTRGRIHIGAHAVLGTNVIVFPGVTIGEGAAVGAGCIVRHDLEPWGIYTGLNSRDPHAGGPVAAGVNPVLAGHRDGVAIRTKAEALLRATGA